MNQNGSFSTVVKSNQDRYRNVEATNINGMLVS